MAVYRLWANAINGGVTGAMDVIDPTDIDGSTTALTVGSTCEVTDEANGIEATYEAYNDGPGTEDYPNEIVPDTNPGNWYWKLVTLRYAYEDAINSAVGYNNTPGAF